MLTQFWKVIAVFMIPIGGGIPAGVLLARSFDFNWQITLLLYLVSDIILALLFEPVILIIIAVAKKSPFIARVREDFIKRTQKLVAFYGTRLSPAKIILISFGMDPMTGRAAAITAGHGFVAGWCLAIAGDMIYFAMLMVSTLFLNSILGDGLTTTLIMLSIMILISLILKRFNVGGPAKPSQSA